MKEKIIVLGGGESGIGAALLAKARGCDVFLSDNGLIPVENKQELSKVDIEFEEGQHNTDRVLSADEIVKSPGIPDTAPIVAKAIELGIPVISEIEYALRHTKAQCIGITGTNGKTTTTLLTYHILKENGLDVGLAGNVGFSLARQVAQNDHEYYVIELSSFQLDGMYHAKLNTAILLNITPDHLNRYDNDFQKYIDSKFRIIRNMRSSDTFIYNADDSHIAEGVSALDSKVSIAPIAMKKGQKSMAYTMDQNLMFKDGDSYKRISKSHLTLQGRHNMLNTMSAILAARQCNITWDNITSALSTFKNAPHRMEYIGDINGRHFYNDSKATNVDAVWYALDSFNKPLVLIMGGTDKGNDYAPIDHLVKEKVKAIVVLGLDYTKITTHFKSMVDDITTTDSVFSAVKIAYSKADEGDVVLLSPACASFDLFKNYEDRGDRFKMAFRGLQENIDNNQKTTI